MHCVGSFFVSILKPGRKRFKKAPIRGIEPRATATLQMKGGNVSRYTISDCKGLGTSKPRSLSFTMVMSKISIPHRKHLLYTPWIAALSLQQRELLSLLNVEGQAMY